MGGDLTSLGKGAVMYLDYNPNISPTGYSVVLLGDFKVEVGDGGATWEDVTGRPTSLI